MIIRLLFVFASLPLVSGLAYAQSETPPVINPADIFAEGVEVVDMLPVLTYDNAARLLWYFEPEKLVWQSYEYPVEIEMLTDYQQRSDGTYLISSEVDGIAGMNPETVWLFDPNNWVVRKPPTVCNLVQALPGEGQWLLTQLPEDNLYRLCNNETGMTTKPLPDDLQSKVQRVCGRYEPFSFGIPALSPNGNWVVFYTCEQEYAPGLHVFYAYNVSTDHITKLGMAEFFQIISINHWISDTQPITVVGDFRTGSTHEAWISEVTIPKSANLLARQYAYHLRYFDNPPRLLWVENENVSDALDSDIEQTVHEYRLDVQTDRQLLEHTCTYMTCEAGYVVWADDEIVALWNGYPLNIDFEFSIWDIHTNTKLFETTTGFAEVLNSNHFIISRFNPDLGKVLAVISIKDHEVSEEIYDNALVYNSDNLYLSPNRYKVLILLDSDYLSAETDRNVFAADIYDFTSNRRTILMEEYRSDFNFELRWLDEDHIGVDMLLQREECNWYNCIIGSWLVQTA